MNLLFLKEVSFKRTWPLFISLIFISGCATYQHKLQRVRKNIKEGDYTEAASKLKKLAATENRDQLVYILDYATVLQLSKDYDESKNMFILADELSEFKDYTSISKEASSLAFSEELVQYKGDDYEKIMINVMNAINFLLTDNLEGALVEIRQFNDKLRLYNQKRNYSFDDSLFAIYLGGLIWEASGNWSSAYIDFLKAYQLKPEIPYLKQDLIRSAKNAQRITDYKKWKKKFKIKIEETNRDQDHGELVLIYQQGWGPRKYFNPAFPRLPKLYPVPTNTVSAALEVHDSADESISKRELTQNIYNVESIAIQTLNRQYAPLLAKRLTGLVVKDQIRQKVQKEDPMLGLVADIAMHISDRADLRQWSTLPQSFQVAKLKLNSGKYKVSVSGLNKQGQSTGESMPPTWVEVKRGQKKFITWRSVH